MSSKDEETLITYPVVQISIIVSRGCASFVAMASMVITIAANLIQGIQG